MGHKAVFVDRDGTINIDGPYLSDPNKFEMYPGVGNGIKELQENGFKIIVITNQSGIARGFFTEKDLDEIHDKMKREFEKFNVKLDGIYYCPHHPEEKCNCRKPNTGMFDKAIKEHDIDVKKSYMVGDKDLDVVAGRKVGTKTIRIHFSDITADYVIEKSKIDSSPDYIARDFADAAGWILKNR